MRPSRYIWLFGKSRNGGWRKTTFGSPGDGSKGFIASVLAELLLDVLAGFEVEAAAGGGGFATIAAGGACGEYGRGLKDSADEVKKDISGVAV